MKTAKPVTSIRIDRDLLEEAKKQGLKLAPLVERTIAKAVKGKKCPCCGGKIDK